MINFGTIGTGWITDSYIHAAHATGKWNLAAVYSRTEESAKEFASKYAGNKAAVYTSLDDLASDTNISTVYIASPNILHYAQAKQMLQAGKHVVLEKPFCSTVEELDDLFKLAKEKKVILVEAFRHIQEANFKILKKNIEKLGTLYGASITYAQYSSRYDAVLRGEKPNIFNLEMGGGALVDLGVYCVAAAVELFGAPEKSTFWPVKIATGCDGAGRLMLQYPNFTVYLCYSKIYTSDTVSEIYGENGTLIVPLITDIESVVLLDPRTKSKTELAGPKEPPELNLKEEVVEFTRLIEEQDWKGMERYETLSRNILKILQDARRENGLLFPGGI